MFNSTFKNILAAGLFAAAALGSTSASATVVLSTGYDLPNGNGQAIGGNFNYWDAGYTGSGSVTTDGAALTGGRGKLTDGIVSNSRWDAVSNAAGTGEYVGWYQGGVTNPLLTFHFAGSPTITSIVLQIDNSGYGNVFAPNAILVDGVSQTFVAPAFGTVGLVTLGGLSLSGNSHTLQFVQGGGTWTFVSEVLFDSAVPEPAVWMLMIAGFGMTGFAARRGRTNVVAA